VIPKSAIVVIGHDDDGALPQRTPADSFDDACHFPIAIENVGVSGMLVLLADRFEIGDRG
jgi:hypothetical protein